MMGKFKNKRLALPPRDTSRPTKNIVRKAIFDIAAHRFLFDFNEKVVLDMCTGSGALGLEALSRGARAATFIDTHTQTLEKNIRALRVEHMVKIIKKDVLALSDVEPFDIAFFDPPYADQPLIDHGLFLLKQHKGLICFECHAQFSCNMPISDRRTYGNTSIIFISNI